MARLGVRLSDETLEKWNTYCAQRGLKPATAVRQAIEEQVSNLAADQPGSVIEPRANQPDEKKVRVSVWLTESECQAVDERASLHGGTRANWIIRLIRAVLTKEPQLTDKALSELGESNYQLAYIGRNLGKIRRHLAEADSEQRVELKSIDELSESIKAHTALVDRLIRLNAERWSIK